MATRLETQNKRRRMRDAIIESCEDGRLQNGDLIPPLRELARQYGLSVDLASEVIQSLVADGILYARQGAGIIVGNPRPANPGIYLFLLPKGAEPDYVATGYVGLVLRSFELSIAQLGGACLTVAMEKIGEYAENGQLPPLAGVFSIDPEPTELNRLLAQQKVPHAYFGAFQTEDQISEATSLDVVKFDDLDGGRQATQHLLAAGHNKVAFIALHTPEEVGHFTWSAERESGWREAMQQAGKPSGNLVFHPSHIPVPLPEDERHGADQYQAAREAVAPLPSLVEKRKVTAVVATNFLAARALFTVLQESEVAPELWPAVMCFDVFEGMGNNVVSALNLPWDEVGKAGAQLLWERHVGRLRGPDETRLVKMQLIPRLTCRPDWAETSSLVVPHLEVLALPNPSIKVALSVAQ